MTDQVDIKVPEDQEESTSATLSCWLNEVGDWVEENEPLAELETDKVNVEVVAPISGRLVSVLVEEGSEVGPGQVLGRMSSNAQGEQAPPQEPAAEETKAETPVEKEPAEAISPEGETPKKRPVRKAGGAGGRLSPAVKKLLRDHDLDPKLISGTGQGGRITQQDVLEYVEQEPSTPIPPPTITGNLVPHDPMRRRIADHMVKSLLKTAPHVTAVFEMDFTAVMAHRKNQKESFADRGVNLTYTAYFAMASVAALKAVPQVNSRFHQEGLELFDHCHLGIGTALEDKGLIVPVIHNAQDLDLFQMASKLQDLTQKARDGKLTAKDVQGGTFTISNHGVSGTLIATPIIINQPQSAILGIGKLEKRVVVAEENGQDVMAIRPRAYVTLSIDHRALDAWHTNSFLTKFVEIIENWS